MNEIIKIIDFEGGAELEVHLSECKNCDDFKSRINIKTYYTDEKGQRREKDNPNSNYYERLEWNEKNTAEVLNDITNRLDADALIINSVSTVSVL